SPSEHWRHEQVVLSVSNRKLSQQQQLIVVLRPSVAPSPSVLPRPVFSSQRAPHPGATVMERQHVDNKLPSPLGLGLNAQPPSGTPGLTRSEVGGGEERWDVRLTETTEWQREKWQREGSNKMRFRGLAPGASEHKPPLALFGLLLDISVSRKDWVVFQRRRPLFLRLSFFA
ncbi:hypothetical protein KUCAC02_004292, partial [Chaenocephalus aceratus]